MCDRCPKTKDTPDTNSIGIENNHRYLIKMLHGADGEKHGKLSLTVPVCGGYNSPTLQNRYFRFLRTTVCKRKGIRGPFFPRLLG